MRHLEYLTGYSGGGIYYAPFPLVLSPEREPTFVVREFDEGSVRAQAWIDDLATYTYEQELAGVCADVLRRHNLHDKRVGMELGCQNLAPADVAALQSQLTELKIVDSTKLVAHVAAVKSDREIEAIREAARLTDCAELTFLDSLKVGVSEQEVAAAIERNVSAAGGTVVDVDMAFGERLRLPHAGVSDYVIKYNEAAYLELSGKKNGYVAPLLRSAVVGRNPVLEDLHAIASDALQAGIDLMKPGTTTGEVSAAIRAVVGRSAPPRALRSRTGYQIGTWWSDRGDVDIAPGNEDILVPNMTFHLPIFLFQPSGYQIGCSESVLITNNGAEVLSKLPRSIRLIA
jgi:Xaa-Pro dipeptidase